MPPPRVLYFLLALLSAVPAAARDFRSSDVYPFDFPTVQAVSYMDEVLRERSGGTLSIGSLGNDDRNSESYTLAKLRTGSLDMARVSLTALAARAPLAVVASLPYVFRSTGHMRRVLDGPIGEEILASFEAQGLIGLCFYEGGARSIYSIGRPIRHPRDLKGMRIGIEPTETWSLVFKALGAQPLPLPLDRVATALRSGLIDAAENDLTSYVTLRHNLVARNFNLTQHAISLSVLVFSGQVWADLSDEDRDLIKAAARESVAYLREHWEEYTATARDSIAAAGGRVIEDVDRAAFADALTPLYPTILEGPRQRALLRRIQAPE